MCFDEESYMGATTNIHDWIDDIISEMNTLYPGYDLVGGTIEMKNGFTTPNCMSLNGYLRLY